MQMHRYAGLVPMQGTIKISADMDKFLVQETTECLYSIARLLSRFSMTTSNIKAWVDLLVSLGESEPEHHEGSSRKAL